MDLFHKLQVFDYDQKQCSYASAKLYQFIY